MQKYPIGIQDFEKLRTNNFVYVDKTMYIEQLVNGSTNYFLSRPRRFGKSLFMSTLKYVFQGRKDLFAGLYIEDKIEWKAKHVIHLDFSNEAWKELGLKKHLINMLNEHACLLNIELKKESLADKFKELITSCEDSPVLLIDEYDKPILHFIGVDNERANANREIMREFYSVLKPLEGNIHFLFITGITRFSKTSLFSDMNHLKDITINKIYTGICGYTQSEMDFYFEEVYQACAISKGKTLHDFKQEVKIWYNGYRWFENTETVYNPFSILNFFDDGGEFQNYWFNSGMPTFLINTLNQNGDYDFEEVDVDELALSNFSIENLKSTTLMFQAGYLTIKDRKEDIYTLVYPNMEVKKALLASVLSDKSFEDSSLPLIYKLREFFEKKELEEIRDAIDGLFANIPHQIFNAKSEYYYHSIILVAFQLLGCIADAEVSTLRGRIDAVVKTKKYIYILEFKVNQNAEIALAQIKDRAYYKKYHNDGREIILLGINFENKEIKDFLVG